jgi:hypothetical protein
LSERRDIRVNAFLASVFVRDTRRIATWSISGKR